MVLFTFKIWQLTLKVNDILVLLNSSRLANGIMNAINGSLSLHSFHHRRIVNDIVTIYSIISGCMSIPLLPTISFITPSIITRGHNLKKSIPILRYPTSKTKFHFQDCSTLERFACLTPLYTISNYFSSSNCCLCSG